MIKSTFAAVKSILDPGDWRAMKPALDPSATVLSFDYKSSPAVWKLRMTVGAAVLAIVATVIYFSTSEDITFVAVGFGAFALVNILRALAESRFETSIVITDNMAIVKRRTFFGRRDWQEPLENYRGVLLWERTTRQGHYHIVELAHDDSGRTLPLFVTREKGTTRDIQEAFARRFDLPALYPDGDRTVARDVDTLDRTLDDHASGVAEDAPGFLIGEHRDADALPVDPGPAPSGVIVTRNSDAIRITVVQGAIRKSLAWLLWMVIPCVFGGIVFMLDPYMGIFAFGASAVFVLMMLGLQRLFRGSREDNQPLIGLDLDRIWVKDAKGSDFAGAIERFFDRLLMAAGPPSPTERAMGREAIEQIRVDRGAARVRSSQTGNSETAHVWRLIIENDEDRLIFAARESDQGKMEWVRDFLRHELARGVVA